MPWIQTPLALTEAIYVLISCSLHVYEGFLPSKRNDIKYFRYISNYSCFALYPNRAQDSGKSELVTGSNAQDYEINK